MPEIDTVVFLKSMGVYITDARRMILSAFLEKENALTQAEILRFTNEAIDRVTIWRTLDLFVSKGIIHAIPSMDSLNRYALLQSKNRAGCFNNHLHFMCDSCGKTICLDTVPVPSIVLPVGFMSKQTEVIVKGTCKNCQ